MNELIKHININTLNIYLIEDYSIPIYIIHKVISLSQIMIYIVYYSINIFQWSFYF